ncbi:MAG: phage integrase SAM-like domain-containing protein, partial [Bacteroidales bacterium]|nr:phage integrase SAM-like domain-containing protein [Bacteroidales bacterium]
MHIKRSIKFLLHTRKKGDAQNGKNVAIRMRISYAGTAIDFPTGHNVDAAFWDNTSQHALPGFENKGGQKTTDINRTIDEYRAFVNDIFARYELLEKRKPTLDEIKDLFNDMVGRKTTLSATLDESEVDFFKAMDLFTQTVGGQNQWGSATYEKFKAIKAHLQAFDKKLNFDKMNDDTMQKYMQWLYKKEMINTTVAKNIDYARWFLRWSAQKGYYNGTAHETFKPRFKGIDGNSKEIIFLSQEELQLLPSYVGKAHLERVRDVFLFCCFTGLRYSDVAKLSKSDINQGVIRIVTQKTSESLIIELNKHSKAILDRYRDMNFPNNKALPVISNQKMNDELKILGQLCELNAPQKIVHFQGNQRIENEYPKWAL